MKATGHRRVLEHRWRRKDRKTNFELLANDIPLLWALTYSVAVALTGQSISGCDELRNAQIGSAAASFCVRPQTAGIPAVSTVTGSVTAA
jgi:hypothetical protein